MKTFFNCGRKLIWFGLDNYNLIAFGSTNFIDRTGNFTNTILFNFGLKIYVNYKERMGEGG